MRPLFESGMKIAREGEVPCIEMGKNGAVHGFGFTRKGLKR